MMRSNSFTDSLMTRLQQLQQVRRTTIQLTKISRLKMKNFSLKCKPRSERTCSGDQLLILAIQCMVWCGPTAQATTTGILAILQAVQLPAQSKSSTGL